MKFVFHFAGLRVSLLAAILSPCMAGAKNIRPVWTLDVDKDLGLRSFRTQLTLTWSKQQNVIFLDSGRVIVYQVNQLAEPARLAGRERSGGAGNFFLEVRVLDANNGRILQSLRVPTNAEFSKIILTREGKLLVRTGNTLHLCTSEFHTLASRPLPLNGEAPVEAWQIGVSPSGDEVALVHVQAGSFSETLSEPMGERGLTEVEILDAGTLKTVKAFSIPRRLYAWSAGDGTLVAANPRFSAGEDRFGFLDFEGKWSALAVKGDSCPYRMEALAPDMVGARGCGRVAVVNAKGDKLFSREVGKDFLVDSVSLSGRYLAVELGRHAMTHIPGTNFPVMVPKPERLEVYDITTEKRLLSLAVKSNNLYYAISAGGALVVIDGSTLALYRVQAD